MNKNAERITANEVHVGDRIARSRNDRFALVAQIDEGPVSRRFHFEREPCDEPELEVAPEGRASYCPRCHRREDTIAETGHGPTGGGNIRPRREAKLWRLP